MLLITYYLYILFHISQYFEKTIIQYINNDTIPQIFMPEYFNQFGYVHGRLALSPDGNEAFWVISTSKLEKRFIIKRINDTAWSLPENTFLNVSFKETSPCYSPDGQRIFYQSRRNQNNLLELKNLDIYYRERTENDFGEPVNIGFPINTDADEGRPWIGKDGTLWFTRISDSTKSDIYYSKYKNNKFTEPIKLGNEINTQYEESEPIISPEGNYLLFISNRPGGYSKMMNLYISIKNRDNTWSESICLSNYLKIDNIWFPTITFDGKYLFFCGGYPTKQGYDKSNYYQIKLINLLEKII